jgi:hypothetical protein
MIVPVPSDAFEPRRGFSYLEGDNRNSHVWAIARRAELRVLNVPEKVNSVLYSFELATLNPRSVKITQPDGREQNVDLVPGKPRAVEVCLSKGDSGNMITFETDSEGVNPEKSDRTLFFDVNLRTGIMKVAVPSHMLKLVGGFSYVEDDGKNSHAWAVACRAELHVPDILCVSRVAALPASVRSTYLQLRAGVLWSPAWNRSQ